MLDPVDQLIVGLLQEDGRVPVRRLADAARMSETAIRQRLQKLQSEGVIRVVGLIDPQAIGRPLIAWFLIRTEADSMEVARALAALPEIRWLARCGEFDQLIAQTSCATNNELLEIANTKVRATRGVKSAETLIHLQTHVTQFRFPAVGSDGRLAEVWVRGAAPSRRLDDIDRVIVDALNGDGRTTFKRLGDLTGLTTASARQRYQRLVRDGILRVRAVPIPARLGMHLVALLGLKVRGSSSSVASSIAGRPEATFVCESAGRYDVLAEVVCRDQPHFEGLYHDAIAIAEGVRDTEVFVYRDVVKQSYDF